MQIVEISDRSGGGQDYFAGRGLAAGAGGVAAAAGAGGGAQPEVVGAAGAAAAGPRRPRPVIQHGRARRSRRFAPLGGSLATNPKSRPHTARTCTPPTTQ